MKAVDTIHIALPEKASRKSTTLVCTISSDGKIHLYDLAALPESSTEKIQLPPVVKYDTKGTRLTCLTLADGDVAKGAAVNGKRKRDDEAPEDGDSDDDDAGFGSPQEDGGEDQESDEDEEE